jgi:vacuolar protein sorting-associated protein 13A/C
VAARTKYYLDPRREARGWKVTPVTAAEQQLNQEMPDAMPCMDYKRVWAAGKGAGGAPALSVWRPVGPPGYASLGDVAMPGSEPPARPVTVYKGVSLGDDDAARSAPGRGAAAGGCGGDGEDGPPPLPRLAAPVAFQLVFRDSGGSHGVSIWRPVPPKG